MQCGIEPCMPRALSGLREDCHGTGVITQTRCKKPLLSYYHRVVNAAHYLSSCHVVILPVYHQFSAISTQ